MFLHSDTNCSGLVPKPLPSCSTSEDWKKKKEKEKKVGLISVKYSANHLIRACLKTAW